MEPGETLIDTARREVMEEIGIELDELALMDVFSGPEQYFRYPNGDQVFNVTTVYTAKARHWHLILDPVEVTATHFFSMREIPDDLISSEVPILECYFRRMGCSSDPWSAPG